MDITAAIVFAVAFVVGVTSIVVLFRRQRNMAAIMVMCALVLLSVFTVPILLNISYTMFTQTTSPVYFMYMLGLLCLFTVVYPTTSQSMWKERLRIYFLVLTIIVLLYMIAPLLLGVGLSAPIVSLVYMTAVMLSCTIGTMVTADYSTKRRKKQCGLSHPVWGAVAVSHLLCYGAIGVLFAMPTICAIGVAEVVVCATSMILASMAAAGVAIEGDYWDGVSDRPTSIADSSALLGAALCATKQRRSHRSR